MPQLRRKKPAPRKDVTVKATTSKKGRPDPPLPALPKEPEEAIQVQDDTETEPENIEEEEKEQEYTVSSEDDDDEEDEEAVEEEDVQQGTEGTQAKGEGQPQTKKSRTPSLNLDERDEVALITWYQENNCFYDKRIKQYKNKDYKNKLMMDKAKEMSLEVQQLLVFFKSMRTRYVKIRKDKQKSGSGLMMLSARDQFIFDSFEFLDIHVTKSKTRKSAKFPQTPSSSCSDVAPAMRQRSSSEASVSLPSTSRPASAEMPDLDADEDVVLVKEEKADGNGKGKGKGKSSASKTSSSSTVEETQALALRLVDQATKLGEAQQALNQPKTNKEKEVQRLLGFLETQMLKIPDDNWWDFTMEAMGLVRRFQQPRGQQLQNIPVQGYTGQQDYYMQQPMMQQPQTSYVYKPPTPQNVPPLRRTGMTPSPVSSQPASIGFGQLSPLSAYYAASPGYPNLQTPQTEPLSARPVPTQSSTSSQPSGSGQSSVDKETEAATAVLSDVMNQSLSDLLPN